MYEFAIEPDTYGIIAAQTQDHLLGDVRVEFGVGISHGPLMSSQRRVQINNPVRGNSRSPAELFAGDFDHPILARLNVRFTARLGK